MVFDRVLISSLSDCSGRFMWCSLSVPLQSVLVDIYSLSCERLFFDLLTNTRETPSAFCSHILTLQNITRIYSLADGGRSGNDLMFQEGDRRTSKEQHASRKLSALISDFYTKHNRC